MKYLLMDVGGTTTSISFVHDVLFPYSRQHLKNFVHNSVHLPEVQEIIGHTQETAKIENNISLSLEGAIAELDGWIVADRKHPALKKLQGLIWHKGYVSGELKGHVYPDVPQAFKLWRQKGLGLGIYSSGSIEAQKDLFGFSSAGDLTSFLSHHFDTSIGAKRDEQSYTRIAFELKLSPQDITFLSDIKDELDAAKKAGFQTIQLVRNPPLSPQGHSQVNHFLELPF